MKEHYDVCVFGHISREIKNGVGEADQRHPGGTAFNTAATLAGLGANVALVTKIAESDRDEMFAALRKLHVNSIALPSPTTTVFENISHSRENGIERRVQSVAAPFFDQDLDTVSADWILLGPQSAIEMGVEFVNAATSKAAVALDIQGLVRVVEGGNVVIRARSGLLPSLSGVTILKADQDEAYSLTGVRDPEKAARTIQALGPREVIVTMGDEGSVIYVDEEYHRVPAFAPRSFVEHTGCGDSFLAGYLYRRMLGDGPVNAGQFASVLAALKISQQGPFTGSAQHVNDARDLLRY